jgi:hypothetical protein
MSTIHNGFINKKLTNSLKDTGLNNFDLATTRIYKGVKPMWEQLGFESDDSDIPITASYWNNIIPSEFDFLNKSGIEIQDGEDPMIGSKTPRTPYKEIVINEDDEQIWDSNYLYPILPKVSKFGEFVGDVNVENSYGKSDAPITNLNEVDNNLILDVDFGINTTDSLFDKTDFSKLHYNQDFDLSLDDNLRLKTDTFIIPDGIEKDNSEQAF